MNLAALSIKRPIFITCLVLVMLVVGFRSFMNLGVDLFPNITFPVVVVSTPYPGASPSEIETLISKPIEDEVSTIAGLKRLSSNNMDGLSQVIAEFTLETDVKYAEQQIRDRMSSVKRKLPDDIEEPVIRRMDPGDLDVLRISLEGDLPEEKLFHVADKVVKPLLEQVPQVGLVEVIGGREREIKVELDRAKLKQYEISASQVAMRLTAAGQNVPVGKVNQGRKELSFRSLGEFSSVADVKHTIVNFFGSDVPVTVAQVGTVTDSLKDEASRAFVNGKKSLFIYVFKQSGSNTIAVVRNAIAQMKKANLTLAKMEGAPKLAVVRDASHWINVNVADVKESIYFGIVFSMIVVFFFLANGRSTIITGLALPNSLIGAFVLMAMAGFTVNIMTLLALSLSVGLLIDDAIVVRENIFRHIEKGEPPAKAALNGTLEVQLAVIATTFTVLAVFGPVGFLKGMVGQFFKEFGLTICFAMLISLFDALTVAPMLSAYFAGKSHGGDRPTRNPITLAVRAFSRFQDRLEVAYERLLNLVVVHPLKTLGITSLVTLLCFGSVALVPATFLPPQDSGEFMVSYDLPPGASLDEATKVGMEIDTIIRKNPEVEVTALTVGGRTGEANVGNSYVRLIPSKQRKKANTSQVKARVRDQLKNYASVNVAVKDFDAVGGGQRPFNLNIVGDDQEKLQAFTEKVLAYAKKHPGLLDADVNFRAGKPEFQIPIDKTRADKLGVSTQQAGMELRTQIEGLTTAKFREEGEEYDIRVRLREDQRDLRKNFSETYVPNINGNLVRLRDVAKAVEATGPSKITRQDRARYIQIQADITPGGPGMGGVMNDLELAFKNELKLPDDMRHAYVGQAENFMELMTNMGIAMAFGVLFIYLILSSLYESFVTPFTIMLALPLALCGSLVALAVTQQSLDIFSMIGMIMLLGVATKNSILLVDYANQRTAEGMDRAKAAIEAGRTRLRPILMTTMALIAGTIPIAIGFNEASKQRTSMGVAIIGGLISSTLLTLIVVPAAYIYIDRFRVWSTAKVMKLFGGQGGAEA